MGNVLTPEFRASYPKLLKPELNKLNGKQEYSVVALFKKGEDLSTLKKAVEEVLVEEFGTDKAKWPKNLKSPFRDQGDKEKEGVMPNGYVKGAIFLTLKSSQKPGVVDANVQPIISDSDFYAGCFARASVRAAYYDQAGNRGVNLYLQNVQKTRDGDPMSGRPAATSEFAPVESNDSEDMWK
jgi:hypothetical protein